MVKKTYCNYFDKCYKSWDDNFCIADFIFSENYHNYTTFDGVCAKRVFLDLEIKAGASSL